MEQADSSRHRAKVYCLNANGQWDDRGTGHAAVQYSPVRQHSVSSAEQAAFVVVISEDEGHQTLLQARVHMEDIYQRQQGAPLLCLAVPPALASLTVAAA
eukprot:scaffold11310_cov107-Isochrysis_galbana.AAC.6